MTKARVRVGYVAIGRNEGERLVRCLQSLPRQSGAVVYVDSGSTDASVAAAQALKVDVVALDMAEPFTAARARNAGFLRLVEIAPDADYVQFIDGDCELADGWAAAALKAFAGDRRRAIVVGRCREKRREASLYNRLCDIEWDRPPGETEACGGIFMVERAAFEKVGGFNAAVIAGEEPELCIRLRARGRTIFRVSDPMCAHDAAMTRFSQWWKRSVRSGHAFAQVGALHRGYFRRERRRALLWGLALPAGAILLAPFTFGLSLLAFALYPLAIIRLRFNLKKKGLAAKDAGDYALFLTIAKFAEALGVVRYWRGRLAGRKPVIIEYK